MPKKASIHAQRPRLYIDVTPELRREIKAAAALEDMTISEFILACVVDRLNEGDDLTEALERLRQVEQETARVEEIRRDSKERSLWGERLAGLERQARPVPWEEVKRLRGERRRDL